MNVFTAGLIEDIAEATGSNDGDIIYTKGIILECKERGISREDAKYIIECIKDIHKGAIINNK